MIEEDNGNNTSDDEDVNVAFLFVDKKDLSILKII